MGASVAKVDLDAVYRVTAKGKTYVYAWRGKGAPRLKAREGSDEFVEELAAALATRRVGDGKTIASLCAMWRASVAWSDEKDPKFPAEKALAKSTRKNWKSFLTAAQTEFGELTLKMFEANNTLHIRKDIKRWRNTYGANPRQADMAKQVLSALLTFAVKRDMLTANPCIGIDNLYEANRADRIWTQDDLAQLEKKAPAHVFRAAKLAALTGLRQADLLRLSWSHVSDLAIEIRTGKSGGKKTALIPIYGELRAMLDSISKVSTRVLVNSEDHPWQSGFSASWNKALFAAGFKQADKHGRIIFDANLHFHDLRGTAATRMYIGGLSIREIAEIFTWGEDQVERLINRYVKRDELLRDKIRRMDENARRTEGVKPSAKPSGENS